MNKGSLSRKLLLVVILVSTFYTLLTTSYYLYLEYLNIVKGLNSNVETIKKNYLQPFASSLYKMDEMQLKLELEGALNLTGIVKLHVQEQSGPQYSWEVGKTEPEISYSSYKFPLIYELQSGVEEIGMLTVTTDNSWIYNQLWRKVFIILATNAVKVFFAALTIYFFIQYIITRHLVNIAKFVTKLDLTQETSPLILDKSNSVSGKEDELDLVVQSINEMVAKILDDKEKQQEYERFLQESEERYALAQRLANVGSWDLNIMTGILKWSGNVESMFGFKQGEFAGTYEAFLATVHEDDRQFVEDSVNAAIDDEQDYEIEHRIVWPDGTIRWVLESGDALKDKNGKAIRMLGVVKDFTGRKLIEEEREKLVAELQSALKEIKTLQGILPICSFCKKIRDDNGYWNQVEVYVKEHTEADFSHSFCPECAKKHYPDFVDENGNTSSS